MNRSQNSLVENEKTKSEFQTAAITYKNKSSTDLFPCERDVSVS